MSEDYEFEDDDAPKAAPKKSGGGDFDPFADEDTGPSTPVAAPPPQAAPAQAPASSGGGFDAFADGGDAADPDAESAGDADIKPGQGKDLWLCPHCGAKNKPNRDTCRNCGKSPDDEVIIPLFSRPEVKIGLVAVVALVLVVLFFVMTAKDFSLRAASAATVSADYVHDDSSLLAGVGRVFRVKESNNGIDVVIVFGAEVNTDDFKDLKGPDKFFTMKRGNYGVQPHIRLSIVGSVPTVKRGDYMAFSGNAKAEEFKEGTVQRHYKVDASEMQFNVSNPE